VAPSSEVAKVGKQRAVRPELKSPYGPLCLRIGFSTRWIGITMTRVNVEKRGSYKMKALRFLGGGRVTIEQRAAPEADEDEVVVQVGYSALCGSDKRIIRDGSSRVPGHEIAGLVRDDSNGREATVLKRVVIYIPLYCGHCSQCSNGYTNRCNEMAGVIGWQVDGGLAEYVKVPGRNVVEVPNDIPLRRAVLALDTIGTATNGLHRLYHCEARNDVPIVVLGAGALGIGVAAVALYEGREVFVYDPNRERAEVCVGFGARYLNVEAVCASEKSRFRECSVVEASGSRTARKLAEVLVGQGAGVLMLGESSEEWCLGGSVRWRRTEACYVRSFYFPLTQMAENWRIVREIGAKLEDHILTYAGFDGAVDVVGTFSAGDVIKPVFTMDAVGSWDKGK
jgi:threonine dehydrogenase-like Zn-dependent dehydrogenase